MSARLSHAIVGAVLLATAATAYAGKMSDRHKKWIEEDVRCLVSKDEDKAFRDLKDDAERDHFIEVFWARRDPTPLTPRNELKEEYERRLAFVVSDKFPHTRGGIRSDMAHVFLLIGQPDKQEKTEDGLTWTYPALQKFGSTHPSHFTFADKGTGFELDIGQSDGWTMLAAVPGALLLHPDLHDLPTYPHMMDKAMTAMIDAFAQTGQARDEIPLDMTVRYMKSQGGATYVCLIANIQGKPSTKLAAFGRCIQQSGAQEFNEPMDAMTTGERAFAYTGFAVMPGTYDLLLGITDKTASKTTLRKIPLEVPNFDTSKLEMTTLLISDKIEPVAGERSGTSSGGPVNPYVFGHYKLTPRTDAVFTKDSSLFVFYNVYNPGLTNAETQLMVEYVFNKDGSFFNRIPPELTQEKAGDVAALVMGTEVQLATFPAGNYTVTVKIEDKVTKAQASRELPFVVR